MPLMNPYLRIVLSPCLGSLGGSWGWSWGWALAAGGLTPPWGPAGKNHKESLTGQKKKEGRFMSSVVAGRRILFS